MIVMEQGITPNNIGITSAMNLVTRLSERLDDDTAGAEDDPWWAEG